jgi:peptide/nickel transport system substrate-binding protein
MGKRKFWLVLGVTCAAVGLSASSAFAATDAAAKKPQGPAATGGTVIFGADQEPRTLNTFTVEGNAAWGSYVLAPVVTWGSKYNNRGVLVHDLLQSVTLNDQSPLTVTYRIKPAAKWSDNRPVTSADMIFTYQQIMNPNNSISSRVGFEDIASIRAQGSKAVRVVYKKIFAAYESLWGRFLPAHSAGGIAGQDFNQAWRNGPAIANGPFRFVSWSRGSQMVVQKNPNYWGKAATLNQIVFRFIPDTNTQFQAMRGGEVNIIHPQPQQQIADIKGQRGITVQTSSQFAWEHVDFQLGAGGHAALKRKFVREAIVTGVNRSQMRAVLYKDIAPNLPALNNVVYKNFQPEYQAHKYQPHGFSQRKAISLLRSNGCTGGPATPSASNRDIYSCPGVGRLEFDFWSTAGNQQRELAFQIMQAQLRSIGIQLNSRFTLTALTVTLPTRNWDIMLYAWVGSPDPAGSVNIHRCGGTQNHQNYCSRPVSRLLLKSNETLNARERTRLMNESSRLIASHVVTLPLYARPTFLIHDSRLRGALLNPTNTGPTWNTEAWSFVR